MAAENTIASEITPEVSEHIAAVNRSRIERNTDFRYHRIFWGAYKQHVHELLVGASVGTAAGALLGLTVLAFVGWPAIVIGAAAGLAYAAEKIGSIGSTSGAHAASLAEKHASALDPANEGDPLKIANDRLMSGAGGHNYDFATRETRKKYFYLRSGATGAAIGAASGALLGTISIFGAQAAGVQVTAIPVIGHILVAGGLMGLLGPVAAPIIIGALIFGVLGLTYGIDRGIFKSIFNKMDTFLTGRKEPVGDPGKEQAHAMGIPNDELYTHRLQRQEDIHALQSAYDKNIFMGGLRGYLKGLVGGVTIGAVIGAVTGALALGALAIVAIHVAAVAAPVIMIAATVAFAGYFGTVFSESGYNAGTEATARAIDDELPRAQAAARGIPEAPEREAKEAGIVGKAFNNLLGGIRKISEASKNMYNQLNDYPGSPGSKENAMLLAEATADAKAAEATAAYYAKISPEDARELDRKLEKDVKQGQADRTSNVAPKNINDIIREQGMNYPDFTTMLANQKADCVPTHNKS